MAATLISVLKLMDLMDIAFPSDVAWGSLLKVLFVHHQGPPVGPSESSFIGFCCLRSQLGWGPVRPWVWA